MNTYYNENDSYAAAWLRNLVATGLIPRGTVEERSIIDVSPDLAGYTQCHFFSGIGGWPLALDLAGWPADRPVWTGSCPCQPFSSAGKQGGSADERHLWPQWFRLIRECRPDTIFGEQVAGAVGFGWLDRVFADLEALGYACGAAVLGAHSVGAPHIRQRLFWVADADLDRQDGCNGPDGGWPETYGEPGARRQVRGLGDASGTRCGQRSALTSSGAEGDCPQRAAERTWPSGWADAVWLPCLDGKARRAQSSVLGVVDGLSGFLGRGGSINETLFAVRRLLGGDEGLFAATLLFAAMLRQLSDCEGNIAEQWEKACSEAFRRDDMPALWEQAKSSAASQGRKSAQRLPRQHRNPLPRLPQGYARYIWDVGFWSGTDELLCRMWQQFHGEGSPLAGQDLLPRMPERMGAPLCDETLANRTGRLRAYGDAIVPQAAAEFIRAVMEIL